MSQQALNVLLRVKNVTKKLKDANDLVSDVLSAYVDAGVQAEVAALPLPTDPVPGTNITKQEYLDIIATCTQFVNFYRNVAVVTQNNQEYINKVFKGS